MNERPNLVAGGGSSNADAWDARKPKALYTFNWIGGGYNQVWAHTKPEAVKEIARQFPQRAGFAILNPDLSTLQRRVSKKSQDAWWGSFQLMD